MGTVGTLFLFSYTIRMHNLNGGCLGNNGICVCGVVILFVAAAAIDICYSGRVAAVLSRMIGEIPPTTSYIVL